MSARVGPHGAAKTGSGSEESSPIALRQCRKFGPHLISMNDAAPPPFLSLARKWRPQTFAEVVGHEYAARVLQNAARDQRLHHAFLFTGTRGVGKTTLARIVAKMVNCPDAKDGAPCLKCEMCEQIAAGRMLDVVELDAASHTKVEEMRSLLESALYPPAQGKCKVFIIDEAHMLSKSAMAAMLKTLEEPPAWLKFVLATTDPQKLPPTIMSRCLCFALRPLERSRISERLGEILREEKREFDDAAVETVARLARGSMRDALSILEQALAHNDKKLSADSVRRITGDLDYGLLSEMLREIAAANAAAAPDFARRLQNEGAGFDSALSRLAALLYKIALFRVAPDAAAESAEEREVIESAAPLFGEEEVQVLYEIAVRGRQQLPHAPDEQTGFEMTLLRMMCFMPQNAGDGFASGNANRNSSSAASEKSSSAAAASSSAASQAESEIVAPAVVAKKSSGEMRTKKESDNNAKNNALQSENVKEHVQERVQEHVDERSWRRAVAELRGTAKALAEGCIPLKLSADGAVLRADKSQKHNRSLMLAELESQLQKRFGAAFRITLVDGEDDAALDARAREMLDAAKQTPFVRDVLAAFPEAEVRAGSVEIYRHNGDGQ